MPAMDFPNSPTDGQLFTPTNGATYQWSASGSRWILKPLGPQFLPLAGGTMTGDIVLAADANAPLEPTTKQQVDTATALAMPKAGGTFTGAITLSGDAATALQPASKQQLDAVGTAATTGAQAAMSAEDNLLCNGAFDIWQRGTPLAFTIGTSGKIADRWKLDCGAGSTVTVSQWPNSPGVLGGGGDHMSYGIAVNRTVTSATTWLSQPIEDVRTTEGKAVVVSFQVFAASATSATQIQFNQNFGTGGSPSTTVTGAPISFTINVANTWERKTITTTIPSISGKTLGTNNDSSLIFYISMPSGLGNTIMYLSNVDIRFGSVAPGQFLRRPIAQELALCQRYYQTFSNLTAAGYNGAGSGVLTEFTFPQMRATPTVAYSGQSYNNASALATSGVTNNHLRTSFNVTATGSGFATFVVTLDAEL